MATGSAKRVFHGTLVATTVDTITMSNLTASVQVDNRGSGDIFVTTDGTTPTVGGAECYVVPANSNRVFPTNVRHGVGTWLDYDGVTTVGTAGPTSFAVKLISSGTPAYSVTCL